MHLSIILNYTIIDSMQDLAAQIHKRLLIKKKTIATAESCTGGMLANLLTKHPASSLFFKLGTVVYSNQAKIDLLAIPPSLINNKGAVSRDVAIRMSKAIRILARTDIGIGITGIAGPAGGTKNKPVGTVFIAVNTKKKRICRRFHFKGSRAHIRSAACQSALEMLKQSL
jgi:nicotinamide-nucleotide amidase